MQHYSGLKRIWDYWVLGAIAVIILTMLVPILPWTMDLLMAGNICISVLLVCATIFVRQPVSLTTFPTILLLATLFRLALNVASTRLILTRANPGQIITGFGVSVAGSDIIVGTVIFSMLLLVLFLVITKGAERVAEVAARFSLDAMPGMQAAIDSDRRNKSISGQELAQRRRLLEQKSMFYGSLDGAMKFVRGDAVAALVITVINIGGGVLVGTVRRAMSVGEALNLYGTLTIGDGLATMLSALLVSTAAAILVSRVGEADDSVRLGYRLRIQFMSEPIALSGAALTVLCVGFVPKLPLWPFLLGGVLFAIFAFRAWRKKPNETGGLEGLSPSVRDRGTLDALAHELESLSNVHPVLVRESVEGRVSLPYLAEIVSEFEKDGIGRADLPALLEALSREKIVDDIDDLLIRVRGRLRAEITASVGTEPASDILDAVQLDETAEALVRQYTVSTSRGKELALPPDDARAMRKAVEDATSGQVAPVILISPQLRRQVARYLNDSIDCVFVSPQDLVPSVQVNITKVISF
jgi:flagellar biosynthesis component FlhA